MPIHTQTFLPLDPLLNIYFMISYLIFDVFLCFVADPATTGFGVLRVGFVK